MYVLLLRTKNGREYYIDYIWNVQGAQFNFDGNTRLIGKCRSIYEDSWRICGIYFLPYSYYKKYKNRRENNDYYYYYRLSRCTIKNNAFHRFIIRLHTSSPRIHINCRSKKFHRVEIFITGFVPLLNFMDCKSRKMIGFSACVFFFILHNRTPRAFYTVGSMQRY